MEIVCFTNVNDTNELNQSNTFDFQLKFISSFEKMPNSKFYIVSLKMATKIYSQFIKFMHEHCDSKFIFLDEYTEALSDEDFEIRYEDNTFTGMYAPATALRQIKELEL